MQRFHRRHRRPVTASNLDPYRLKIAVSTGARGPGRRKFCVGSVEDLRNEWKSMGVNIVRPEKADYVVVPDGTDDIGKIEAVPIHYSTFVDLLNRHPSPMVVPKRNRQLEHSSRRGVKQEVLNTVDAVIKAPPEFDWHEAEAELKSAQQTWSTNHVEIRGRSKIRPPSPPKPSKRKKEKKTRPRSKTKPLRVKPRFVRDPRLGRPPRDNRKLHSMAMTWMKDATSPDWFSFVQELVHPDPLRFFPSTFNQKQNLIDSMAINLHSLLEYFAELRVSMEGQASVTPHFDVPPRLDLDTVNPCSEPTNIGQLDMGYLKRGTRWGGSNEPAWNHYRQTWNREYQHILYHEDLFTRANATFQAKLVRYFWEIESDLYLMYASVLCASAQLKHVFIAWIKDTRKRFAHFQNDSVCATTPSESCHGLCVFKDNQCRAKPFVFVLDDLVLAYCGSTELLPTSSTDQRMVLVLWNMLKEIYITWFASLPSNFSDDFSDAIPTACTQILEMHKIIMGRLKKSLDLEVQQEIMWDQLPQILDLDQSQWEDLWSDQPDKRDLVIDHLKNEIYSEKYQKLLSDVVSSLSKASVTPTP